MLTWLKNLIWGGQVSTDTKPSTRERSSILKVPVKSEHNDYVLSWSKNVQILDSQFVKGSGYWIHDTTFGCKTYIYSDGEFELKLRYQMSGCDCPPEVVYIEG